MTTATSVLRADRWAAGGDAIARGDDGRVVFVHGAIPGELVEVELVDERRDWSRGRLVVVVEPSPTRIDEPCGSRRNGCGGCGWMHLEPLAQLDAKAAVAADALRRIGRRDDVDVEVGATVPEAGYRTTLRIAGDAEGRAGFRGEQSHDVVAAPHCLVAVEPLRALVADLRIAADAEAVVRYSVATGVVGAMWQGDDDMVTGLPAGVVVGPGATMHEDVAGVRLQVSLASFFQSGPAAAELLVATVADLTPELAEAETIVDAYGGIGLFAACAAPAAERVHLVETGRSAVADAAVNLAGRNVSIHRGEVGGWHAPAEEQFDVVVADPARSGLGKPGTAALARLDAPVLTLVSCDPASLGRDVRLLADRGYRLERCVVVDTFPQTTHVETVSRFVREG